MNILVLRGGPTNEHAISMKSATFCIQALQELGFHVNAFTVTDDLPSLITFITQMKPDIVFNTIHGAFGEDGTLQGILNWLKIPYTHSGRLASTILMDKPTTLSFFRAHNIPVAQSHVFQHIQDIKLPFPFVIKPCNEGSSINVYCCHSENDVPKKWPYKNGLVETYIPGKELTVTVLNGKALTVTEIISHNNFYNFHNKYTPQATIHKIPADIPTHIFNQACLYAEKIWNLLTCRGMIRVDFRLHIDDQHLFFLEGNTVPGMTKTSLAPEQARSCGIAFESLVNQLIEQATWDL